MMCFIYHHDVRTTLTLEEDVANRLHQKARQTGTSFKAVVNETLRLGLNSESGRGISKAVLKWRESPLQVGRPFESTSELLETLEGGARDS